MNLFKYSKLLILLILVMGIQSVSAQNEIELITNTLNDYIEGTSNGDPDRIARAFHPDLNLYTVDGDALKMTSGEKYITFFKKGEKKNRVGRIISIDYENNAATAKVEIKTPKLKRIYTDYFLLLKLDGNWKIIHKSYTFIDYPE